jgi:hypothetical protein
VVGFIAGAPPRRAADGPCRRDHLRRQGGAGDKIEAMKIRRNPRCGFAGSLGSTMLKALKRLR